MATNPESINAIREKLKLAMKIVEQSPVILFRRKPTPDPRLVYVSSNIARFGYPAQDFIEEKITFRDLVHPEDRDRLRREIEDFAADNTGEYSQNYRIVTRWGETRWVEDATTTERDAQGRIIYYQGTVVDVTERKLAEEALRKNEAKFRRIVETAAEGFVMMDSTFKFVDVNDAFCRMLGYARKELIGLSPFELATPEFRTFLENNAARLLSQPHRTFEGRYQAKSKRIVPVLIHGNTLVDDKGDLIGHVAFVTDLTEQKRSLILAGEVQKSLLPKSPPQIPGLDIAGHSLPCEEIGGDYYDFLQPTAVPVIDMLTVAVGDIAGHGVDSALLMASARALLRERFSSAGGLADIIGDLNRAILGDFLTTSQFMTLFALAIDRSRNKVRWVRAGHDPALLYHPDDDRFIELGGQGIALGVKEAYRFEEYATTDIRPGSVIALGTDGIWEAFNPEGEMFGKNRLKDVIRRYADQPAAVILKKVYQSVKKFTRGQKPQDDITLVVVKLEAA